MSGRQPPTHRYASPAREADDSSSSSSSSGDVDKMLRLLDDVRDGRLDTKRALSMLTDTSSPSLQVQRYRDEHDRRYGGSGASTYEEYGRYPNDHRRGARLSDREQQFQQHELVQMVRPVADDRAAYGAFALCCMPVKRCYGIVEKVVMFFVGSFVFLGFLGLSMKFCLFIWPWLWASWW